MSEWMKVRYGDLLETGNLSWALPQAAKFQEGLIDVESKAFKNWCSRQQAEWLKTIDTTYPNGTHRIYVKMDSYNERLRERWEADVLYSMPY